LISAFSEAYRTNHRSKCYSSKSDAFPFMSLKTDIIIIGGGLAGLTAALHLQKAGVEVLLVENHTYPNHKVCGEYVSNEVLPYLKWLGADPEQLNPAVISRLKFTTISGKSISTPLPLGGFGISRFMLDNFLYETFVAKGGKVLKDKVISIKYSQEAFEIITANDIVIFAKHAIGAYGKRSAVDVKLNRSFIQKKSPYLAVKAHYSGTIENEVVSLHNFSGGYCGVSSIEDQKINICYLADYSTFSKHKSILSYQQQVLYKNKRLEEVMENSKMLFNQPLTISQISFDDKEAVVDHMLMIGDSAGLIHPLCGNGMGMGIHSAKLCAELLIKFCNGTINSRNKLEITYISSWNSLFRPRLNMGRILSAALEHKSLTNFALKGLMRLPSLLPMIIKRTHGKPLIINE